jgi:hypothetical protein
MPDLVPSQGQECLNFLAIHMLFQGTNFGWDIGV